MADGPMSTPRRPAPRSIGTPTMPTSATWGLFTYLIVVEAPTRLTPEISGGDHLAQQRGRRKTRLFELVEQDVGDEQGGVEADEVEQCERSHRVAGAEHHANVDVF